VKKIAMKYKVGQKVIILPSALEINVAEGSIDKAAIITHYCYDDGYAIKEGQNCWAVRGRDISPAIAVGQQLMLFEV